MSEEPEFKALISIPQDIWMLLCRGLIDAPALNDLFKYGIDRTFYYIKAAHCADALSFYWSQRFAQETLISQMWAQFAGRVIDSKRFNEWIAQNLDPPAVYYEKVAEAADNFILQWQNRYGPGIPPPIQTVDGYVCQPTDSYVLVDSTAGDLHVILCSQKAMMVPSIAVRNIGTHNLLVRANDKSPVERVTFYTIAAGKAVTFIQDGTAYWGIAAF